MSNIKIRANGKYLPTKKVMSQELEKQMHLEEGYIQRRTGIEERYYTKEETIQEIAQKAVEDLSVKYGKLEDIGLIITATTTTNCLMPGISNEIQKKFRIEKCICLDILAGCSGYINAIDIARLYLEKGTVRKAIVIGVDILSHYTDKTDIGTSIILSDGAGATLLEKSDTPKKYASNIEAEGENNEILTCKSGDTIYMDGKAIYRYAVTQTVANIKKLLEKEKVKIEDINYIVPHQSNKKIIKAMANRLKISENKVYTNIEKVGNTFCASIPIGLAQMEEEKILQEGDKILLVGYGGGLNTGSILLEY